MENYSSQFTMVIGNYRYSSWSLRAWLAMVHSGLPFETVRIPLCQDNTSEEIWKYSPSGMVPCLVQDVEPTPIKVWDSLAIIDYLAHIVPDKYWWPSDPAAYAFARSLVAEMHTGFNKIRTACPMNLGVTFQDLEVDPDLQQEIDRLEALWIEARTRFGLTSMNPGPFLFGEWSVVDMMFAPIVTRFITYGVKLGQVGRAYIANVDSYGPMDQWRMEAQREPADGYPATDAMAETVRETGKLGAGLF